VLDRLPLLVMVKVLTALILLFFLLLPLEVAVAAVILILDYQEVLDEMADLVVELAQQVLQVELPN